MKLNEWREMLAELRNAAGSSGRIPLPVALQVLRANSQATMFRRIAELNAAGFQITTQGDAVILHQWPAWVTAQS